MSAALTRDRMEFVLKAALEGLDQIETDRGRSQLSEGHLWTELVACLLGSAVSFEVAHTFAEHLRSGGFLDLENFRSNPNRFEQCITKELDRPLPLSSGDGVARRRYRFPVLRAKHVCRTATRLYLYGSGLRQLLESSWSEIERRRRLVEVCIGIGPKQASLFLRNVGYATELAILDVHVLRFMNMVVLNRPARPPGTCLRAYELLEKRLRSYAEDFGTRLARLDTAIWVVMRVLQREAMAWL